jgi:hypothetical protein
MYRNKYVADLYADFHQLYQKNTEKRFALFEETGHCNRVAQTSLILVTSAWRMLPNEGLLLLILAILLWVVIIILFGVFLSPQTRKIKKTYQLQKEIENILLDLYYARNYPSVDQAYIIWLEEKYEEFRQSVSEPDSL